MTTKEFYCCGKRLVFIQEYHTILKADEMPPLEPKLRVIHDCERLLVWQDRMRFYFKKHEQQTEN